MNKKFASLGTALSRDEAKKIMGGGDKVGEFGDAAGCSTGSCSYAASPGSSTILTGTCTTNTNPMQVGCGCKKGDGTIFADSGCNTPVIVP